MIRQAKLQDLDALVALEGKCFQHDAFPRATFRYFLTKSRALTWVATAAGKLVGYCIMLQTTRSKSARLYSIAVDPDCQGQGLAKQLLQQVELTALDAGKQQLILEVRQDNQRAIAFYQHQGYVLFGHYKNYYQDAMDALRFAKHLTR
jgi:ribosomal-protein-alanine acetyltransferase